YPPLLSAGSDEIKKALEAKKEAMIAATIKNQQPTVDEECTIKQISGSDAAVERLATKDDKTGVRRDRSLSPNQENVKHQDDESVAVKSDKEEKRGEVSRPRSVMSPS